MTSFRVLCLAGIVLSFAGCGPRSGFTAGDTVVCTPVSGPVWYVAKTEEELRTVATAIRDQDSQRLAALDHLGRIVETRHESLGTYLRAAGNGIHQVKMRLQRSDGTEFEFVGYIDQSATRIAKATDADQQRVTEAVARRYADVLREAEEQLAVERRKTEQRIADDAAESAANAIHDRQVIERRKAKYEGSDCWDTATIGQPIELLDGTLDNKRPVGVALAIDAKDVDLLDLGFRAERPTRELPAHFTVPLGSQVTPQEIEPGYVRVSVTGPDGQSRIGHVKRFKPLTAKDE